MSDVTDYGPTIADLERKRDEIDRTIQMLRALSGMPAVEATARNGSGPTELTNKHFHGMRAPEAVLLYLETVKEARGATRIANDLVEHGFITTSGLPANTIRTTLRRLESSGQVVQVKKEWGLPIWYPGLRRNTRDVVTSEPSKKPKASAKKVRRHAKKSTPARSSAKKKGETRSPYNTFMGEQFAKGLTMKEAAAAWQEHKKKAQS